MGSPPKTGTDSMLCAMAEADDFYTKAVAFIHRTLEEGWNRKDAVEWASYEEMFPTAEQTSEE